MRRISGDSQQLALRPLTSHSVLHALDPGDALGKEESPADTHGIRTEAQCFDHVGAPADTSIDVNLELALLLLPAGISRSELLGVLQQVFG
jgi:hypothetical protein